MRAPWLLVALAPACATFDSAEEVDMTVPNVRLVYNVCPEPQKPRTLGVAASLPALDVVAGGSFDGALVLSHAGLGAQLDAGELVAEAAKLALRRIVEGGAAADGAAAGAAVLEDDGRFNAGAGAIARLDGKTVQMDAAIAANEGTFAAVAAIERVKNPILVVRRLMDSPYAILSGPGATRAAHAMGFQDFEPPGASERGERPRDLYDPLQHGARELDWRALWNFPGKAPRRPADAVPRKGESVAVVARAGDGEFAAAISTGGAESALSGTLGKAALFGAGVYAGKFGAVACTGDDAAIVEHLLARRVHELLASGLSAKDAAHTAVAELPDEVVVGVIAVDRTGWGVASSGPLVYATAADEHAEK